MKVSGEFSRSPLSASGILLRAVLCFVIGLGNTLAMAAGQQMSPEKDFAKIQKYFDQQKSRDQSTLKGIISEKNTDKKSEALSRFIHEKVGSLAAYKESVLTSDVDQTSKDVQVFLSEISRQADYYARMMGDLGPLTSANDLNDFADQLAQDSQSAFFVELFLILAFSFLLAAIFTPAYYYTYTPVTVVYDEKTDQFYYYRGHRRIVYI